MTAPPLISRSGSGTVSGVLATLVVPSKGRPPLNTLGTGHYSSLEGEGGRGAAEDFGLNKVKFSRSPL